MDWFSYRVNNISRKLNLGTMTRLLFSVCLLFFFLFVCSFLLLLSFCSLLLKPQGVHTICLCDRFLFIVNALDLLFAS